MGRRAPASRPRCVRCKKPLTPVYALDSIEVEGPSMGVAVVKTHVRRSKLLGFGFGATGFFCTLTCGHQWAVCQLREREAQS